MLDTPLMLWELSVTEQRYRAVLEVLAGVPVTEVAERYGVSRQSVHAWLVRYRGEGPPGLAETYRRDAYHLIRAGLTGGKGITPAVATHPVVFATFTAPSFGPVHTRLVRQHTCPDKTRCTCRPEPCHARRNPGTCPHGRPEACFTRHRPGDPRLGQPLCQDYYDYPAHVVWNNQAGELWRRTKQAIERHLGQLARRRGVPPIRVPCGHGKYRSVSPDPRCARQSCRIPDPRRRPLPRPAPPGRHRPPDPDRLMPPPAGLTVADLDDATLWAAKAIGYLTDPHPDRPGGWLIGWGTETDVRAITMAGTGELTDQAVASYLAKYSTKGTEATGHASARITDATIELYANPRAPIPNGSSPRAGPSALSPATPACAAGRTCSASAAIS